VDNPSIDVIVNNYDYGPFLRAAIDSALAQTHERVRVVVVDDGSTDDSRTIIESYGSRIVPVLKENAGQASAFNAGLSESTSELVLFLDADDILQPDICSKVAGAFRSDPAAARVQYRMEVIDQRGAPTGIVKPPNYVRLPSGDLRRHAVQFPFDVPWMATSGNAFSSKAIRRIAPVPEEDFRILADWYLVHLTTLLGTVVSLDDVGAYRRLHDRNLHELSQPVLDLSQLRQSIEAAAGVTPYLLELAADLGLADDRKRMRAVSDVGNRLIYLRLGPKDDRLPGDTRLKLLRAGIRASLGRFDVAPVMRLVFIGWLLAEAFAPRRSARHLAELFAFPERRGRLSPLLAGLRRY
jgi:glycosyltransferase involved in cell wall biosynthesis